MDELSPYLIRKLSPAAANPEAAFQRPVIELVEDAETTEGFVPRDYWRIVKKHSRLVVAFFLGVVFSALAALWMMTPIYTAKTTLLIERNPPRVVDIPQVLSESVAPDEHDYYKTQYEILKSRRLAAQVIQEQGLQKNPLFSEPENTGFVTDLWASAKQRLEEFFPVSPQLKPQSPLGISIQVIDKYVNDLLEVTPIRGTRLVSVSFRAPDPELSARVANAHAGAYIRQGVMLRTQANQEAHQFLEAKLAELRDRVEKSEESLNHYRRDKKILSLDSKENIVVERLADLNKRLTETEIERIAFETQVQLIRSRDYDSVPAVLSSTLIQALKEQLIRLEGEQANLATQFKPGYPRLAQLKAQVEEVQRRLQQEIQRVVQGVESSYLAARDKERELRARMEEQTAATLGLKDAAVRYAILAREADTNRQLYESVLERMKQIGVAAELRASNVFIIDAAEPPIQPSSPKKKLALLLSVVIGLIGGIGLAFLLEQMDNTLKVPEEVERRLGLPNLGVVPDFFTLDSRRSRFLPHGSTPTPRAESRSLIVGNKNSPKQIRLSHHSHSMVNEAYRTLRTAILLSQSGGPPKTILFTSGTPGEGKTVTVINTAITFAQMGVKVLVIDADLRRSSCHKLFGLPNRPGLADWLSGQTSLEKLITPTAMNNVFFLGSGSTPPNPTELVGSRRMHDALAFLGERYDYLLIDSSPVLAVSDAVLLSTMVDGVVMVVSGQETPRNAVKRACARLRYAQAKILGVVLNRVNMQDPDYVDSCYQYYTDTRAESQKA